MEAEIQDLSEEIKKIDENIEEKELEIDKSNEKINELIPI